MDTRRELKQGLWELLAVIEHAQLLGDTDQVKRLKRIARQLLSG